VCAERGLAGAARVIQQTDIGVAFAAVKIRCETVR
jgi:hypothetical protein